MLDDILHNDAAKIRAEFADHDTDAFTRRLAARIASGSSTAAPTPQDPHVPSDKRPATPRSQVRPARRTFRRRPTPIVTTDPALAPAAVFAEVKRLCDLVLRSRDVDRLEDFAADFDQAGARVFGCLLYVLDRHESGLYWWRFAAGAGDELAAHLLAMHHAAAGCTPHARLWRAIARIMGYTPERHMPRTVRRHGDPPENFVHTVQWGPQIQTFLRMNHLPKELAA
jgi:hypothetical protein